MTFTPLRRLAVRLDHLIADWVVQLAARWGIAGIFWMSARSKVDGLLHITDGTYGLFRDEYRLPLIPSDIAAQIATYSEHLFALLLAVGLLTRLSALALLVMTVVIEVFVYPDAWPTHLSWAALLLLLVGRGGGVFSLDGLLGLEDQGDAAARRR